MIDAALVCLALNIYYEARGEDIDGQIAVAAVTLNRVEDPAYPDTICGVVYQPHQFSWTTRPAPLKNPVAFAEALSIAEDAEPDPDYGTHYHTTDSHPYWAPKLTRLGSVGNHIFYK